jgi:hypothetical protein
MQPLITQINGAGKLLLVLFILISSQINSKQAWTRVPVTHTSCSLTSQTTIMADPVGTLPVILEQYSVVKAGNAALMKWSTALEENALEFIMERSDDGLAFTAVARIPAFGTAHSYALTDSTPKSGLNFYRLKLVHRDGRETIFGTRSLFFDFLPVCT